MRDFSDGLAIRVAVTLFAGALIIVHLATPRVALDGPTFGLIVLMVVPWLSSVFKSIEVSGVGKIEYQDIRRQVDELKEQAGEASETATIAIATSAATATRSNTQESAQSMLSELVNRYQEIRAKTPRSDERTKKMDEVLGEMISASASLPLTDVAAFLKDGHSGNRLAAYAYLYARPQPSLFSDLVCAVTDVEDTSFGQYWGIRAIGHAVQQDCTLLTPQSRRRLRELMNLLSPSTARYRALEGILRVSPGMQEFRSRPDVD